MLTRRWPAALLLGSCLLLTAGAALGGYRHPPDYTVPDAVRPDGLPDAAVRHDVTRPATAADRAGARATAALRPGWRVVDPVVSNVDPLFRQTDRVDDGEPFIAVNPRHPQQVALLTGRDGWEAWRKGGCTPDPSFCSQGAGNDHGSVWLSDDGGRSWAKRYDIPTPTGVDNPVCTCDRVLTWTPDGLLVGAFLVSTDAVRVATTRDPFAESPWTWPLGPDGKAVAVARHDALPVTVGPVGTQGYIDQPWIATAPDPLDRSRRNVFVSFADDGSRGYDLRYGIWVATSHGIDVLDFTDKTQISKFPLCCDDDQPQAIEPFPPAAASMVPRLAANERTGTVWALYGVPRGYVLFGPNPHGQAFDTIVRPAARIESRVVRSVDGGRTWTFGGSRAGIPVDTAISVESAAKFGDFSALLGGTHSVAADPRDDSVYVVYADADLLTKKNRLAIRRVSADGVVGPKHYVTGQVDAVLPALAVADDGTVGVLFHTHDGFDPGGFAVVTTHLARSHDGGATFDDTPLVTFSSVEQENADDARQRPLGDYQQLLAVGDTFHGVSVTNGAAFGRPVADWDPLYVLAPTVDRLRP
jgi:hypothetical protein